VLDQTRPVVDTALQSYAGGDKSLFDRGTLLAAKALRSYHPDKGTKLRTHLMNQLQPLRRYHRERTAVTRVPERVTMDLYKMNQESQRLRENIGREPSDTELSRATGLARKRLIHIRRFTGEAAESQLSNDSNEIMYPGVQQISPDQVLLEYVHHDLDSIDQMILEHRSGLYGKPVLSNNDIAARLKLTAGAVSQRAAKIAKRINELRDAGVQA
jgi:RNA polymerase primary sigma factor